ncbi:MAG: hypothetical protein V1729_05845 [Candidatus Woesearchaeota archaeon]
MELDKGQLQTAEHILALIIERKISDAKVVIAKFKQDEGLVEFSTATDPRGMDTALLEQQVNEVISRDLEVTTRILPREDAERG